MPIEVTPGAGALPIHAVLPDLLAALDDAPNAVLVAPPGAGKTTAVAPALLDRRWCTGRVLLLQPRRIAARAAAERIAAMAGQPVGQLIGYATRLDSKQSAATRLLVITQGIFTSMVQDDPELVGVSAVLFDEVHERSLDGDFGLALALDAQAALRPDLRLIAMSATVEGERFAALLGGAALIESEGRSHPIELCHIGRSPQARIEDDMAAAIRRALGETEGGVLAFLPGVAEIERVAERIEPLPLGVRLHRLYGQVDPAAQRIAIAAEPDSARKLVLATSIAETSLTLDGVSVVIDSGLARRPRYDRSAGVTRLSTERVSRAAATQRAGRSGRQRAGIAYRLWEAAATAGLPAHDPPEILEADLSGLVLAAAIWGVGDPGALRWIDPPPTASVSEARRRLTAFDMLDADGRPTTHGRAAARLPLEPRLAHMLLRGGERGIGGIAAEVAVLLTERGLGGSDADLELRLRRWRDERGRRADQARGLARRWAALAGRAQATGGLEDVGTAVALAFPDRVAKRRSGDGADWISIGGRGFRLDPASPLARADWLAVAEVQGAAAGARILSAATIDAGEVEALLSDRIEVVRRVSFDPTTGGVAAMRERRLGAIRLSAGHDADLPAGTIEAALLEGARSDGLAMLPWAGPAGDLRVRAAFAAAAGLDVPDLSDAALIERIDEWLPPLLPRHRRLSDVPPADLAEAIESLIGWAGKIQLDRAAPTRFTTPAGSSHPIDYAAEGGPAAEMRVQTLFGLAAHPTVLEGRLPLVLRLTSPAGRPIQTTKDLPGFWQGSWAAVAKEMRGRYPRHPWPDDPAAAAPTLRTKRAAGS